MQQFHVVKVQPVHKAYAASSGIEQIEMQQVVSRPGLGGTRKRLLDLSGSEGHAVDDAFFGESVQDLIERTMRERHVGELENNLGIGNQGGMEQGDHE